MSTKSRNGILGWIPKCEADTSIKWFKEHFKFLDNISLPLSFAYYGLSLLWFSSHPSSSGLAWVMLVYFMTITANSFLTTSMLNILESVDGVRPLKRTLLCIVFSIFMFTLTTVGVIHNCRDAISCMILLIGYVVIAMQMFNGFTMWMQCTGTKVRWKLFGRFFIVVMLSVVASALAITGVLL